MRVEQMGSDLGGYNRVLAEQMSIRGNWFTTALFGRSMVLAVGVLAILAGLLLGLSTELLLTNAIGVLVLWVLGRWIALHALSGEAVSKYWKVLGIHYAENSGEHFITVKDGLDRVRHFHRKYRWSEIGRGMIQDQVLVSWLDAVSERVIHN